MFNYLFIFIVPIIFIWTLIRYTALFLLLLTSKKVSAKVIDIKIDKNSLDRKYFYIVSLNTNSKFFEAELRGYLSPFIFSKNEEIPVLVNKKTPSRIFPLVLRGKVTSLITRVLIFAFLIIGTLIGADRLNLLSLNAFFFQLVPVIFMVLSFVMLLNRLIIISHMYKKSNRTVGIIKDFIESRDGDNIKTYIPIIEFSDKDKLCISFTSARHYYDKRSLGKKVPVIYNEVHPDFAEIDSFLLKWIYVFFWAAVFLLMFIFFLVI